MDALSEADFDPIAYLNSPRWRNVHLGLERIECLMELLGNPQDSLRFVHVAGTNGKGSTCAYLSSILRACGLRTGMFTSPYIVEFEERIQVDGEKIPADVLHDVTLQVREAAEVVEAEQGEHPTEFELMCAVAFCYFDRMQCDVVVLEVGLGGRYDSTNIVQADLCVITPIGMDHRDTLGTDLVQIAGEKAGIVKEGNQVVSAPQREAVRDVLLERCAEVGARIEFLDADAVSAGAIDLKGGIQAFSYRGIEYQTQLLGAYQPQNASLAIMAAHRLFETTDLILLSDADFEKAISQGVKVTTWPGRFEVLATNPLFIVDGAHNEDGARALRQSILALGEEVKGNVVFIMGVLGDKDYAAMIEQIADLGSAFIAYTPDNPRALPAEALKDCIQKFVNVPVQAASSISEAIALPKNVTPSGALIVAFGTLYSIAQIKSESDR